MQTATKYGRLLGALLLGTAVADLMISSGTSPYLVLFLGCALLLFSRRILKLGILTSVNVGTWYYAQKLPGYRKVPSILGWLHFQLTATPEDRERRVKNRQWNKAHKAEREHIEKMRKRYEGRVYSPAEIASFFAKYSVEVACLALVSDDTFRRRSKLGGVPHLVPGIDWPRSANTGLPYHFLAELHLAEVPRMAETEKLPQDGVLLFFADLSPDEWRSPRVIYQNTAGSPAQTPEDLPELNQYIRKRRRWPEGQNPCLMPEFAVRPVSRRVPCSNTLLPRDVDWNLVNLARKYGENQFAEFVEQEPDLRVSSKHYSYFTIGGPPSDFPNPTGGQGFKLLQLDSDDALGWMIGDVGVLEYWIDPDDLANQRFDQVNWAMGCG